MHSLRSTLNGRYSKASSSVGPPPLKDVGRLDYEDVCCLCIKLPRRVINLCARLVCYQGNASKEKCVLTFHINTCPLDKIMRCPSNVF